MNGRWWFSFGYSVYRNFQQFIRYIMTITFNECGKPAQYAIQIKEYEHTMMKVYSIQRYMITFVRDLRQVVGFFRVLLYRFLHKWNWLQRYRSNIVESGVKYHNPPPNLGTYVFSIWLAITCIWLAIVKCSFRIIMIISVPY